MMMPGRFESILRRRISASRRPRRAQPSGCVSFAIVAHFLDGPK